MGSEAKLVTSCSKDNGRKPCVRLSSFMIDYISAYRSPMAFMWLAFGSDTPRVNDEMRIIMTEL